MILCGRGGGGKRLEYDGLHPNKGTLKQSPTQTCKSLALSIAATSRLRDVPVFFFWTSHWAGGSLWELPNRAGSALDPNGCGSKPMV